MGVAPAPGAPVEVTRYTNEDILDGDQIGSVEIGSTTTNDDGRYQVQLGGDIIDDCGGGRILVSTGAGGLTRAFAYSDEEDITVDAASEAVVRLIYNAVRDQGADLCTPSNDDLRQLVALVTTATTDVSGSTVAQINATAYAVAAADPAVQEELDSIFELTPADTPTRTPTGTATPTGVGPTATITNTAAATATHTATSVPTATNTGAPTSTDTPVGPTNTPTNTPEVSNTPTNTPEVSNTPTNTPTIPVIIDTPTNTPTLPVIVDTPTNTPTLPIVIDTPTATVTATTPAGDNPSIAIGSATGNPGEQAIISYSLDKAGKTINIITPFNFTFDDTRLTFGSCTSTVAGKTVSPPNVVGNQVAVGISGSEDVFPDGTFMTCTFTIKPETTGVAPITFVSAGMADQDFNDYAATGTSGQVTIGGENPTSTPTVAAPTSTPTVAEPTSTATSAPATATNTVAAPPTNTATVAAPPTNTATVAAPATNTPTVAANTPTATTGGGNNPSIAIGSTSGDAGAQVTVGYSLNKAGKTINIITPFNFTFDDTRLTFGSCTSTVAGKTVSPPNVVGNQVAVGISGSEDVFPDGNFMNCTFTIKAEATGVAPITFVSAGMADQDFNDYSASGTSGQVTIGGGAGPTNTPTVAAPSTPTATSAPATATNTVAVPTATSVPPTSTATAVPPTATSVPATPTSTQAAAATPTATVALTNPQITIGTTSGNPGAEVTVGYSLNKAGKTINIITPFNFTFDDTRVTFGACTSTVAGKTVSPPNVVGNQVAVGISGSEDVFPDGNFMNCTFTIKAGVSGVAPITFISAGMADQDFNDYSASGVSGSITVN